MMDCCAVELVLLYLYCCFRTVHFSTTVLTSTRALAPNGHSGIDHESAPTQSGSTDKWLGAPQPVPHNTKCTTAAEHVRSRTCKCTQHQAARIRSTCTAAVAVAQQTAVRQTAAQQEAAQQRDRPAPQHAQHSSCSCTSTAAIEQQLI